MPFGLIFLNGDYGDGPAVRAALVEAALQPDALVIAADGGLRHVHTAGLKPHIVIGDMDSAAPEAVQQARAEGVEVLHFPAHKDETDLELALLLAAERDCNPLRLVGAVGDRLDQTLSNVYLLALPALRGRDVRIVSDKQTTWLAFPGETVITGHSGDTVSLIPLAGDAEGIVTDGLEFTLHRESLLFGPARGVSNVLLAERATVQLERGLLLVIHTVGRA